MNRFKAAVVAWSVVGCAGSMACASSGSDFSREAACSEAVRKAPSDCDDSIYDKKVKSAGTCECSYEVAGLLERWSCSVHVARKEGAAGTALLDIGRAIAESLRQMAP